LVKGNLSERKRIKRFGMDHDVIIHLCRTRKVQLEGRAGEMESENEPRV